MKLQVLLYCLVLALIAPAVHAEETPDAIVAPTEELVLPELELERPSTSWGSPLTLMQWSYGDGADNSEINRPLESDRPYFTKSASVVGWGVWQLETGYKFGEEKYYGISHSYSSFPDANLRIGALAEWFEFRLGWTYLVRSTEGRPNLDSSDPYVGIKLALTPQDDMLPETALLIDTNMSREHNDMQPGVDLIYRWRLNDRWSMGGSSEFRRVSLHHWDAALGFAQTWIFERNFGNALTGYVDWAMLSVDTPPVLDTSHFIDGGLLYLVTDDVQLDASVGFGYGLNGMALDHFVGLGVTIRR